MEINRYIDHTLLRADATSLDIIKLCREAAAYKMASVCVNPHFITIAKDQLQQSNVKICTVVGFPLGATLSDIKVKEAELCIKKGADEIDMVMNISAAKEKNDKMLLRDIKAVTEVCKTHGKLIKVILETCLLSYEEKVRACELAKEAGVDFVKTSTGFSSGGATIEDVYLMKKIVGENIGVKASGGIRDLKSAMAFIGAGATRIGASASVQIITGNSKNNKSDY